MSADSGRLWRIPPESALRHRVWADEHVFFHGAAGDTHRFSEAAALVLLRLMQAPADEAALAAELAALADASPDEAAIALGEILRELARLEYVEPL